MKGWGRRISKRQSGTLTVDVLAVIRLTVVQPRPRARSEAPERASERAKLDVALVAVLSDQGLRRSEAAHCPGADVQRWDDGSGRIIVVRSKTDVETQGVVVAITPCPASTIFAGSLLRRSVLPVHRLCLAALLG